MPPKRKTKKLRTFPLAGKASVKLDPAVAISENDMALLQKMYDTTDLITFPEDFLVLNGDVSKYGWQRVLQFAIYEKYNYFIPFLKQKLRPKVFERLLRQNLLDDFVYVYCTMITLILNTSGTFYDPTEEADMTAPLLDTILVKAEV